MNETAAQRRFGWIPKVTLHHHSQIEVVDVYLKTHTHTQNMTASGYGGLEYKSRLVSPRAWTKCLLLHFSASRQRCQYEKTKQWVQIRNTKNMQNRVKDKSFALICVPNHPIWPLTVEHYYTVNWMRADISNLTSNSAPWQNTHDQITFRHANRRQSC